MDSEEGEGFLPVSHDMNRNQLIVSNNKTGEQVDVCNRYGWSSHNCSCDESKTGIVLYPADLQYKNIVLLMCETCYGYTPGGKTQHEQLEEWYFSIYGDSKSFRFSTGFYMKKDGTLGFNSSSKNTMGSAYHTQDRAMDKFECDVVTRVVREKMDSYDARMKRSEKMLVGVLVDVSGSMQNVLQLDRKPTDRSISRMQSVFNTIINIAENEVNSTMNDKEMFALAFGLKDVPTCDLLALLNHVGILRKRRDSAHRELNYVTDPRELFAQLFEQHRAHYVVKYIRKYMEIEDAKFGFEILSADTNLLLEIIKKLSEKHRQNIPNAHRRLSELLENRGALAREEYLRNSLEDDEAKFAFQILSKDTQLLEKVVDLLPKAITKMNKKPLERLVEALKQRGVLCVDALITGLRNHSSWGSQLDIVLKEYYSMCDNGFLTEGLLADALVLDLPNIMDLHSNADCNQRKNFHTLGFKDTSGFFEKHGKNPEDVYQRLSDLFHRYKAPYVDVYIERHVTTEEAAFAFGFLHNNPYEVQKIVGILPNACKHLSSSLLMSPGRWTGHHGLAAKHVKEDAMRMISRTLYVKIDHSINHIKQNILGLQCRFWGYESILNRIKRIVGEGIRKHIEHKIVSILKTMQNPQTKTAKSVLSLLRDVSGMSSESDSLSPQGKQISVDAISNLTEAILPYIYGKTPMCRALKCALEPLRRDSHKWKVAFLITDGESTDGDPSQFAKKFRDHHVYVCGCLLTSKNISDPRCLYDTAGADWTKAQCSLFELCSTVSNMHPAMAVLLERDWKLPPSGQSRLFLQANHDDVIKEFSDVVRQLGKNNDVLLNLHSHILLDMETVRCQSSIVPLEQEGETCYACAVATVFHLAMRRIMDREGGVPEIREIYEKLINKYKSNCAPTKKVIEEQSGDYRLRHRKVDDECDARRAINARRPLVATFRLTMQQFEKFKAFFKNSPEGILENQHLITDDSSTKPHGHAVVLIECHPTHLKFMNWWGSDKPGGLFFKIKDQSVLNLTFYDIYWDVEDLKDSEKTAFQNKSNRSIKCFLQNMPESVQNLFYECPECKQSSRATEFTGNLREATCPKCHKVFKPVITGFLRTSWES